MQRLIDQATPGTVLRLEPGVYNVTEPLRLRKVLHLDARGVTFRVKYPFNQTVFQVGGPTGQRAERGSIEGLRIEQYESDWRVRNPVGTGLQLLNIKAWTFKSVSVIGFNVGVHWTADSCYSQNNCWEDGILGENRTTFYVEPTAGQFINCNRVLGGNWYTGPNIEGPFTFVNLLPKVCGWWFQNVCLETSSAEGCTWADIGGRGNTFRDCFFEAHSKAGAAKTCPFVLRTGSLGNVLDGEFQDTVTWQDSGYKNKRVTGALS